MFLDKYMNIYILFKIVCICDIQNLYDTMVWPASNIACFIYFIENFSSLCTTKGLFNRWQLS